MKNDKSILVRMPEDLYDTLKQAATLDDRSVSAFIREAIREKVIKTLAEKSM